MSATDVFRRIIAYLDSNSIPYMLTGSFAGAHDGVTRATQDIDIVIDATPLQLCNFTESLPRAQYYVELEAALEAQRRESLFNVIDRDTGWKIDFIFRKSRPFSKEEFERRQPVTVQQIPMFVATAEDVVIAKLEWAEIEKSQRQIEDVAAILRAQREALDIAYIDKWVKELQVNEQWKSAKRAAGMLS